MKGKFAWASAALLSSAVVSLCFGAVGLSPAELLGALVAGTDSTAGRIFWYARLPRTAACILAGAALSTAGCILQNVLANPLASPNIIGINAGAGLAVTICCAAGAVSGWTMAGAAFLGAFAAVTAVAAAARAVGASRTTVILAGVAVNAFLGAAGDAVTTLVPEAALLSSDFRVGGFAGVNGARLIPAALMIALSLAAVLLNSNALEILSLGEETAHGLGLPVAGTRTLFLALAASLSGAAVSFAGLLGFVGLIVPHAVRKISGHECRLLLPLSALWGGAFVTVCDLLARMLFRPVELPVGILLSALGGPFFLWLLAKRGGHHG